MKRLRCLAIASAELAEHPIILAADQVALILSGRKTQLRRLAASPIGSAVAGDHLWVQESFMPVTGGQSDSHESAIKCPQIVKPSSASIAILRDGWQQGRSGSGRQGLPPEKLPVTPSWYQAVHMPRWASRLSLLVTSHRIESLQSISDDDARAEGCGNRWLPWQSPRLRFSRYWDQTRGTAGERWADNPAVVVLCFQIAT